MGVKIVPITDLRRSAASVVEEAAETGEPVYITHRSRPRAVLVGKKDMRASSPVCAIWRLCWPNRSEETSPGRFSESAVPFVRRLIDHNRPLFEELARR
jgi:prevent-host-death family protein